MVSPDNTRTRIEVDPVALLTREHRMILDRLVMVEMAMSPCSGGSGCAKEATRETLRELLEFFAGPVDVHFTREALLVGSLRRILGRKQAAHEQFQGFLDEHRALKAEATAMLQQLARKDRPNATSSAACGGLRPLTGELQALIHRYRELIACEERLLFTVAEMRFTAEQRRRISRRMLQV